LGAAVLLLALSRPADASGPEAAEFDLAQRLRECVGGEVQAAMLATANAAIWRLDRLRARLRLADRQAEAAEALALRRRELAAGLVALNAPARRDARGRLILAGLAQATVTARTRLDALGGEIALLARQQRAAAVALAFSTVRHAAAVAAYRAAGERWRRAMRARMVALSRERTADGAAAGGVVIADAVGVAAPTARLQRHAPADHKRAIGTDLRLDRRLLRLVAAPAAKPRPARLLDQRPPPAGPLWPIAGQVVASGPKGLTIATGIDQVVSSPVAGTVMFAAPFRGLGPLLIIDRGRGYHVVLTGLARLDVRRGASVVAGQSLGEIVARKDGPARLQLELRHRGLPNDPVPWLAAYHDKVRS
jgi:murein DD-endopeptidase MepM/ murein hydrolase activator NlpD